MTDIVSDAELDSSENSDTDPQTPPSHEQQNHLQLRHVDDATASASSHLSSPVSPSFSLHSLGMSPYSPVHRFAAPFARLSSSPQSHRDHAGGEDVTQDSRDILVQRLTDFAARLTQQHQVNGDHVTSLHAMVDDMENTLDAGTYPLRQKTNRPDSSESYVADGRKTSNSSWETPKLKRSSLDTFDRSSIMHPSSLVETEEAAGDMDAELTHVTALSPAQTKTIVAEAQNLCKELGAVATHLRARQEETEHIHELLVTRAERAAQRILYLEERLRELERNEGEMEMLNLQIQLKAIEVQCLSYVPKDADHELRESIAHWKTEWTTLKRKRARRKAGASEHDERPSQDTPSRRTHGSMVISSESGQRRWNESRNDGDS
ncbi:hypothetical protein GGR56DRAFT_369248 [Xylariaceae sp. FL0804]|nr:hypothetical protein GGR56DRAFT_369248 [Xylariaceae sp. FL0804]